MLSRTHLTSLALAAVLPLTLVGCQVDIEGDGGNNGFTKAEARELFGVDSDGNDICALEGWYDDDACDDFCVEPDPDCPVSNCPDPNDPRVSYRGQPGDVVCAQEIDFCGPDAATFNSPECGCGCIEPDPTQTCGGFAGEECPDGQFCDYPLEEMCGAADGQGTCQVIPDACPEYYSPVCGCDNVTYGNECDANAHGVSIIHEGTCEPPAQTCGGIAGETCDDGYFCNMDYQCAVDDGQGYCEIAPQGCPDIWAPVCSCDGVTYSNDCDAHAAGASIAFEGTCEEPIIRCGFAGDGVCPDGQFCNYEIEDMCGWADALGTCEQLPSGCPDNIDPVCGCDGVTYSNECEANAAGQAIVSAGACEFDG